MQAKPITVLLVDDEERIRRSARLILNGDEEVRVIGEADNGQLAAELACRLCPDIIVMDISMPIMNGLEAARKILRECPAVRIIMTTAMGGEPYRRVSMSIGVAGFLEKSSLDSDLLHTIHETAQHGLH
jgi:DNA-binding NarL/FixJ family response regulator